MAGNDSPPPQSRKSAECAEWVSAREAPGLVAKYKCWALDYAKLQVLNAAEDRSVRVRGQIDRLEVWPLSIALCTPIDWEKGSTASRSVPVKSYVPKSDYDFGDCFAARFSDFALETIYELEFCRDDLVAAGLLPAGKTAIEDMAGAEEPPTRWKRDRTIIAMKGLHPPHGIRPPGVSIRQLTKRINKLPEFKDETVSEDTVRNAEIEIKAALEK